MSTPEVNILSIPVKECADFQEDPSFEVVRKSLPATWTPVHVEDHCECCTDCVPLETNNMDNLNFHNDRFEVVINVKGYDPQDIQCNITPNSVQLVAQHEGSASNEQGGMVERNMSMDRNYQLPQAVNPELATCCLSADGILVISAPWDI